MEGSGTAFCYTGGERVPENNQDRIRCQFNAYCKNAIRNKAKDLRREYAKRLEKEDYIEEFPPSRKEKLLLCEAIPENEESYYSVNGMIISKHELKEIIESLPKNRSEIIVLHYYYDLNDSQIGKQLNISRRLANYRKNRGLNDIYKILIEEHGNEKEK